MRANCNCDESNKVAWRPVGHDVCYGQLAVAGPVPETYLVGPRDTNDTAAWRTEIGLSGLRLVRDEMEAHGSRAFTSWQPR